MTITLKNESGMVKEVKKGWSWTVFLFGAFVPLFRGDLKWAGIMLIVHVLLGLTTYGIGNVVAGIFFCATYNKMYAKDLYEKGYRATDPELGDVLLNYVNS